MYKSGVYISSLANSNNQQVGYHSVKLLGWGTEGGEPYWV